MPGLNRVYQRMASGGGRSAQLCRSGDSDIMGRRRTQRGDDMFRPGPEWLVVILVILLLVFGARRLPEIGSSLGRGIRTFKSAVTGEDEKQEEERRKAGSSTNDDIL